MASGYVKLGTQEAKNDMYVVEKFDYAIGNGQVNQTYLQEKVGALNCMSDQQKILKGGDGMDGCKTVVRRLTPL